MVLPTTRAIPRTAPRLAKNYAQKERHSRNGDTANFRYRQLGHCGCCAGELPYQDTSAEFGIADTKQPHLLQPSRVERKGARDSRVEHPKETLLCSQRSRAPLDRSGNRPGYSFVGRRKWPGRAPTG